MDRQIELKARTVIYLGECDPKDYPKTGSSQKTKDRIDRTESISPLGCAKYWLLGLNP